MVRGAGTELLLSDERLEEMGRGRVLGKAFLGVKRWNGNGMV